jgi:rubrerythrin
MPGPINPRYTKAARAAATSKAMAHTWRCPVCEVGWRGTETENECWACPTRTAGRKLYEYPITP